MRSAKIVFLFFVLCAAVAIGARAYRENAPEPATPSAQDASYLDRRITSLEQRLYTIESGLNQIQQQIRISRQSPESTTTRDPQISLLQSEIAILKARMRELECGLVHVDERTLPATVREARKRAGTAKDPCRSDPETPVQISSRP